MKIQTLLWTALAVLSMGVALVSLPQRLSADEMHANPGYVHTDGGDADHNNGGDGTNHGGTADVDHDTNSCPTNHRDLNNDNGGDNTGDHHTGDLHIGGGAVTDNTDHDADHGTGGVATDHRDADHHDKDMSADRGTHFHDNNDSAIRHHESGRNDDRDDRGVVRRDNGGFYEHRGFGIGGAPIFIWDTNNPYDVPGTVWYEREGDGSYKGVWTRRGNSNVFDAVWTYGESTVTAVLTIHVDGDHLNIYRRNGSDGYDYNYTGTISGDGTSIQGTITGGPGVIAPWGATITGPRG